MSRLKTLREYVDNELLMLAEDKRVSATAHLGADLARDVLGKLNITTEEETDTICSAIYHHDDKLVVDSPMDELLKDADVIDHCFKDSLKPVKEKEQVRYANLCKELGLK
ncbi:metal-dependent phosphohydrolase [Pseudobutyrivibrio ruminis]|uniref:Metal-dependent phosphohydrolase n=1 Tax=Pseudobutyrivibrio ruminis TaxID=46206 RepID=A0A2G3DUC5_9FIRM|nr:metal-dependent phosphohydrolase [Pseudobutyrivibrio ruminis]PHU34636.1 metal-dependent phosphohydrolase [Pseudobutyrivibrio ruminis]